MRDVSLKHTSRTSAFVPFDSDVIYPVCGGRPSDPSSLLATATAQMLLCVSISDILPFGSRCQGDSKFSLPTEATHVCSSFAITILTLYRTRHDGTRQKPFKINN